MSLKKQFSKSKNKCKVTFSLPKEVTEGVAEVKLLGEFNNWDPKSGVVMKASAKNGYQATVELDAGREYQFRYLINESRWENDWAADSYVTTPFGVENSVVVLPAVEVAKAKKAPAKKTTVAKKTTAKKTTTKKAVADKLTKIEGIGPKIEKLLKAAGVVTFADLAKAPQKTLKAVLAEAGSRYKMHDPTTWPKQAKLAATAKWDELKTLQDELKGGRAK